MQVRSVTCFRNLLTSAASATCDRQTAPSTSPKPRASCSKARFFQNPMPESNPPPWLSEPTTSESRLLIECRRADDVKHGSTYRVLGGGRAESVAACERCGQA